METVPIGVIHGVTGLQAQACLRGFVDRHPHLRVAGLVEQPGEKGRRGGTRIVSLAEARSFPVFQDLGPAASGCALLPSGLIEASALACRHIAQGCDVAVLSKFAKLEAESRSGLIPAFVAALEAGVPILTYVPEKFEAAWDTFAAPFYVRIAPDDGTIDRWWAERA